MPSTPHVIPAQAGIQINSNLLYTRDGLCELDTRFLDQLKQTDNALYFRLLGARTEPDSLADKDHSQLIIDLAPHLEDFFAELFSIRTELTALKEQHFHLAPLYSCKRLFVQRRALKSVKADEAEKLDGVELLKKLSNFLPQPPATHSLPLEGNTPPVQELELHFARAVMAWLDKEAEHKEQLELAVQYAAWATLSASGKKKHKDGILFKTPRKLDPLHLVEVETELRDGITVLKSHHPLRYRRGFSLTDDGGPLAKTLDETNYCIWCHNQGKDSCSKGLKEKSPSPLRGEGRGEGDASAVPLVTPTQPSPLKGEGFKINSLQIPLAGCPLEEKISEMNFMKSEGVPIGALAIITIDNPMCAGTGHRICNDCMKSCIYQKQEPVNIPQAETRTLRDVLDLPYGFEIYSLLTRWNPLNIHRPVPKSETGKKVLVAGLGPAGYTLAHHLMNDGHTVIGIDGLKIEPLPESVSGVTAQGERVPFQLIRDIATLQENLGERVLAGFGGVAEYGITVRWDKNFLKVIRLLLERREQFAMFGGIRFGGTITIDTAWELGFDHIALCMGAGKPTVLDIPNGLARGVRAASDFLMALQLTGAAKPDSIANLQIRLPVVVIGGGLTAIDTATESLAYYPLQVEKFLTRYETLIAEKGEKSVRATWTPEEIEIAEEFIAHAKALRATPPEKHIELLKSWGGITMAYRKKLTDAPSYRLNHEEVEKALEEGIFIAEGLEPTAVELDEYGHAKAIKMSSRTRFGIPGDSNEMLKQVQHDALLPARTILVAAGTSPNTVLQREAPDQVKLHGKYFQAVDEDGNPVSPERVSKPAIPQVLMNIAQDNRAISFFGDLHPSFAGNVVKAMGSAKQGYPVVSKILERRKVSQQDAGKALPLKRGGLGGDRPFQGDHFNSPSDTLTERARNMRKNPTDAEKKLWQILNREQMEQRFRRQHPIGNYIADFVCTKAKLIVEVDGSQHQEQQSYDAERTRFFETQGYRVLRFWNNEILENIEGVHQIILSALNGHTDNSTELHPIPTQPSPFQGEGFIAHINQQLRATVHDVIRLTPNIVEVVVKAPLSARQFQPGQFYRLQNYETNALTTHNSQLKTTLSMEGLALTGASADKENGLLSTIVLEMGGSSDLCAYLKKGEPVILMGPTGTPTETPAGENVLLVGGGLGNAVLFSIGKALREAGSKVLYFAGYKKAIDRYKVDEIEAAADIVIWCCDETELPKRRAQDLTFHGNIVAAIEWYAAQLAVIKLNSIDRIVAIGSDRMMAAVATARHHQLKPHFKVGHHAIGSINSPMQCMMKEICAQCLQKQIDPATGLEKYVFTCFNQDQSLDEVSFPHLNERLKQNNVQEKLTAQWIDHCLKSMGFRKTAA